MTAPLPTGTVTFLYTDIEGSTPLWERDPVAMRAAVAQHHGILRAAIEANDGHVFKVVGDAFQAAFALAAQAVEAAVAGQRGLTAANWGETGPLRVRMGLHTGTAAAGGADKSSGADTSGSANYDYSTSHTLNRVARVSSAAHGGQILLSAAAAELARGRLPADIFLKDLGEHGLKGISQPERIFQVVVPGLRQDFPPPATQTRAGHNLPRPLTAFIGRERELAELKRALGQERLVTLTGPGGVGKTRLALAAATEMLEAFPDGVWLVELAPVVDPARILPTLAAALGLREAPGVSLGGQVTDFIRSKQTLLILDNCEHLVADCAALADQLLRAGPAIKILASSREGLSITGERVFPVQSLALPEAADETVEKLAQSEAVRLFVARATAIQPRFVLTQQNAAAVAQICRRLDGIPLALELAAARCAVFTPEQIAARLNDRFRLLTGGSRTAMPRHQTLRALVDFSYELLSEPERALLRRCAVFGGGWGFEAAEAVSPELDVLAWLPQLVNKSLVIADAGEGEARYRMLETIRQFAQEKLVEAGEADSTRQQHAYYFLQFAAQENAKLVGPDFLGSLAHLKMEHDNLRGALGWAIDHEPETALRLVAACADLWNWHSHESEARNWCQAVLTAADRLPAVEGEAARERIAARAGVLSAMSWAAVTLGDHRAGRSAAAEAARLAREISNALLLSTSLNSLALATFFLGEPEPALAFAVESVAISRAGGNKRALAIALVILGSATLFVNNDPNQAQAYLDESLRLASEGGSSIGSVFAAFNLARAASMRGDMPTARQKFEEAAAKFRSVGNRRMVMTCLSQLAHGLRQHGHLPEALRYYRETLGGWLELGHRPAVAHELECFAFIAVEQAQAQRAATLFGAAEGLRSAIDTPMMSTEQVEYDQAVGRLRGQLDPETMAAALAEGRMMTPNQAVAFALAWRERAARLAAAGPAQSHILARFPRF